MALLLAASAGAFGVVVFMAAPAGAARSATDAGLCGLLKACAPDIHVDPMAPDGTVHVVYTDPAPAPDTILQDSVSLTVTWSPPVNGPDDVAKPPSTTVTVLGNVDECTGTGPIVCDYSFPNDLKLKGFALNGTYQVSASAQDCIAGAVGGLLSACTSATSPTQAAYLENAPAAPTGVKAVLQQDPTSVKVSWVPSPQPDVAGYSVLRNDGSQACQLATTTKTTEFSCVDTSSGGGSFSYHVVAQRWGRSYADPQKASAPSSASSTVTVPGPTVTTTTSTTVAGSVPPPIVPSGFVPTPTPATPKTGTPPGFSRSSPGAVTPAGAASVETPAAGDTGFQPTLPYGQQPSTTSGDDPGSIAAPVTPHKGSNSVGTIAVVGAGLLIAVIALHGLWLRSEVRRPGPLEVLDPEA